LHIVYIIKLGGGPESFVKNISGNLLKNNIKISLIINDDFDHKKHNFNKLIKVYRPEKYSAITYKIFVLFRILRLSTEAILGKIYKENEKNLWKTLLFIDKQYPISIIEVTEGTRITSIPKNWKVITRAHGSNWTFRMFCSDNIDPYDKIRKKNQKLLMTLSTKNFAISKHLKDHLENELNLPDDSIQYSPYPIPTKHFLKAKRFSSFDIPTNAKVILTIGRIEKRKGMDTMVRSMLEVWCHYPETYLIIIGKETDLTFDKLRLLIPNEKFKYFINPGYIEYSKIPSFYKMADLYVSASEYETFGYTLLESMASGCPLICTDRGAMPELVKHRYNGLIVPYEDKKALSKAIVCLFDNVRLREKLIKNGLEFVKSYDIEVLGLKLIKQYRDIKIN
jgi:glycosyltransferase involved in cell wall biosynthesis